MTGELEYSKEERERKIKAMSAELMRTTCFPFSPKNTAAALHSLGDRMSNVNSEAALWLHNLADGIGGRIKDKNPLFYRALFIRTTYENPEEYAALSGDELSKTTAELIKDLMETLWDSEGNLRTKDAKHAADIRHSKPGGSRDKQKNIRAIWAIGKYTSRDICAEQECASLGMSFSSARKALRNTPNPT